MKYEYTRIRHMREDSDLTQKDIANELPCKSVLILQ